MCIQNVMTDKELEEWKRTQPYVITMHKVGCPTEEGVEPPFFDYQYTWGLNVAPSKSDEGVDAKGFHCYLDLADAVAVARMQSGFALLQNLFYQVFPVSVKKEDVLFVGRRFDGEPNEAIVRALDLQKPYE